MTIHRDMWKEYEREEKEDGSEPKKYVCAHCLTGIVVRLPAMCPECNKYLSEEVKRNKKG